MLPLYFTTTPLPNADPRETKTYNRIETGTPMFTAALFTIVKNRRWGKEIMVIHVTQHYSTM